MKSTDDTPSDDIVPEAKDLWTQSENERRTWLKKLCNQVYDKFISLSCNNINSSLRESTEGDGCVNMQCNCCALDASLPRIFGCYSRRGWWTCVTLLEVHDLLIVSNDDSISILEWK